MKIIGFNGSPHTDGNTYEALNLVFAELKQEGIETEIIHVGNKDIRGCMACGKCAQTKDATCGVKDKYVNEWIQKMIEADGFVLGSPVHFAALGATMKAFLDRAFYVSSVNGNLFRHKVGASIVAVRRSGGLATFNELNNYLSYCEMLIPTSNYWNVIHGRAKGEVLQDEEGMQIMRVLGKNMAYLLKMKQLAEGKIEAPAKEAKIMTSFIR